MKVRGKGKAGVYHHGGGQGQRGVWVPEREKAAWAAGGKQPDWIKERAENGGAAGGQPFYGGGGRDFCSYDSDAPGIGNQEAAESIRIEN